MEHFWKAINFWIPFSLTVRVSFFVAVVVILAIWIFAVPQVNFALRNDKLPKQPEEVNKSKAHSLRYKTPKPSSDDRTDPSHLPDVRFSTSLEVAREMNDVRELTNAENGLSIYALPAGVFGWVESYKVNSPHIWIPDSPMESDFLVAASGTKLSKSPAFSAEIELHKAKDATIYLIGFVPENVRITLQHPSRRSPQNVTITFRIHNEYTDVIALPRDRLIHFESRTFGDGEPVADVHVL